MPEYSIKLPTGVRLSNVIADMPAPLKELLKRAFAIIGSMTPEALEKLPPLALETLKGPEVLSGAEFPSLGMDAENAGTVVSAATFIASLIAGDMPTDEIVKSLSAGLGEPAAPQVLALISKFESGAKELRSVSEKARVSRATLPSLTKFECSLDIRVDFAKDGSPILAPVVVALLDTDAVHQRLWFQMSESQFEGLMKQLEKTRENLKRVANMRLS